MRPSTPSSLVKFAARLASVRIGAPISTPTSAQVPHAMIAARSSAAGTPTYADAVSCDPTWPTVTPVGSPAAAATSGSRGPTVSPGWAIRGKIERGSPSSSIRSVAQSRVATSNRPGRRRVRRLGRDDAGQPVADEVRDQQHTVRAAANSARPRSAASW